MSLAESSTSPDRDPTLDATLSHLFATICDRRDNPNDSSYTCKLFAGGDNKILKKSARRRLRW